MDCLLADYRVDVSCRRHDLHPLGQGQRQMTRHRTVVAMLGSISMICG